MQFAASEQIDGGVGRQLPPPPTPRIVAALSTGCRNKGFDMKNAHTPHEALPGKIKWCSSKAGWQSLRIRHYVHERKVDEFHSAASDDQLIVLVTNGSTAIESFKGGSWKCAQHAPGHMGMTAPGEASRVRWRGSVEHETLHLHLPASIMHAALADLREAQPGVIALPDGFFGLDPIIDVVMRSLVSRAVEGTPDLYAQSAAHFLARHLVTPDSQSSPFKPHRQESVPLGRVDEYMRSHLSAAVSLDMLAAVANCTTFRLIRICKQHWGETPYQRLTRLRMDKGRRLLSRSGASVTAISLECGYAIPSHFATAFRRVVGVSPSAYRDMCQPVQSCDNL